MTSLVKVNNLSVLLNKGSIPIVRDADLALESGNVLCLVGESGSGKTTLALSLLGYARDGSHISAGSVSIDGIDLLRLSAGELRKARSQVVAYVPQDPGTALNPVLPIGEQLTEHIDKSVAGADVAQILDSVGLPNDREFLRRTPSQLSGGQQQRVAIAIAVITRPKLLVLDEPTTGLDVRTQAMVLDLVARICHEYSIAALYVTHDMGVVSQVATTVAVMYAGQVVEIGPRDHLLYRPLHPYTRALLDSVPDVRSAKKLVPIPGMAPTLGIPNRGCAYEARCPFATEVCSREEPELMVAETSRRSRCFHSRERTPAAEVAVTPATPDTKTGSEDPVLELKDISASYGSNQVLFGISFGIQEGSCTALVGESGSGKSTLSRLLIGLHGKHDGVAMYDGAPLAQTASGRSNEQRRKMQYVFQNPYASLNPRMNLEATLLRARRHFVRESRTDSATRVAQILDRVGLSSRILGRYPSDISGGQRQRVAIARALLADPTLLICDEVTSALDVSVQAAIVELLRDLIAEGLSILFVTHDLGVVRSLADTTVVMRDGHVLEIGHSQDVFERPEHPYTQTLLELAPNFHGLQEWKASSDHR